MNKRLVIWFMAFVIGLLGTEIVLSHKQINELEKSNYLLLQQVVKTEEQNRLIYQLYMDTALKPQIEKKSFKLNYPDDVLQDTEKY